MTHLIQIKTIKSEDKGTLSFFEGKNDLGFNIKRIFYTYNVPIGESRGGHAHREIWQFLFCPFGKIEVIADNGWNKMTFVLESPDIGILVPNGIWLDLKWIDSSSVLCVAASDIYNEDEYIRDYQEFKRFVCDN